MNYVIAIPSHNRAGCLRTNTLTLLQAAQIPSECIHIFVGQDEVEKYKSVLLPNYGKIVPCPAKGIGKVRNYIQQYFPENTFIVFIDDDIYGVFRRVNENKMEEFFELDKLIRLGFQEAIRNGTKMWGVYPIDNPYFMKPKVSTDLKFICANFMGIINTHDPTLMVNIDNKEDFERSIIYYLRFGHLIRIDFVGVRSKYYNEPGGLQVDGRQVKERESGEYLIRKYPDLCEFNPLRKEHYEVKLRDRRAR